MNFGELLFSSMLAAVAALAGTALVIFGESWARRNSIFLISFAAGVMLSVAFVNLLPAAHSLYASSWLWVFIGFLFLYVLQNIIMVHPCHDEACAGHHPGHHLSVLSSIGLAIHSMLDGLIISIGFEGGQSLGLLTTFAVMLHKMPDGITITGILVHAHQERKKIILISLAIALVTPLSAALGYFFLRGIPTQYVGMLLALTAGSFIYLAAADLIPETHRIRHQANGAFFFTGVTLVVLAEYLFH